MIVCEFCLLYQPNSKCALSLRNPKGMGCHEFVPTIALFCADPKDFVSLNQITQMATHFGMKGAEFKKVKLMATREESARLQLPIIQPVNQQMEGSLK
jgi:hypothetical protein